VPHFPQRTDNSVKSTGMPFFGGHTGRLLITDDSGQNGPRNVPLEGDDMAFHWNAKMVLDNVAVTPKWQMPYASDGVRV
jgi:hypothetical protein